MPRLRLMLAAAVRLLATRLAAEIEARVPTLRYHQFVAELARLVALAADGHTRLGNIQLADHQRVVVDPGPGEGLDLFYPIEVHVFADGLYAVRAHGSHRALFGLPPEGCFCGGARFIIHARLRMCQRLEGECRNDREDKGSHGSVSLQTHIRLRPDASLEVLEGTLVARLER